MPGLYGIVRTEPDPDLASHLARMAASLRHEPWYVEQSHVDSAFRVALGRTSLGILDTGPQPARSPNNATIGFLDGEVFNRSQPGNDAGRSPDSSQPPSPAAALLAGIYAQGADYLATLDGHFIAALWDSATQRFTLANDRFGIKPLYYCLTPKGLVFASEIKALLTLPEVDRHLDPRGLAQFFSFGHLLGEDTLLQGVRALPAAAMLTFEPDPGRLQVARYRSLDFNDSSRTRDEHLEAIDEAFSEAVAQCTTGSHHFGLSLSGGLDSRSILALINTEQTPITTVSMGIAGSVDQLSAASMARHMGCRHHAYHNDASFLAHYEDHLERMVFLTDGHYLSQCVAEPTIPLYRQLGINVLMRGHVGELMHMDKAYNFSLDPSAFQLDTDASLEAWLWGRLRGWLSDSSVHTIFRGDLGDSIDDLARESLRHALSESAGIPAAPNRIAHLFLTQRIRRETSLSLVQFGTQMENRLPFLASRLVDHLFEAPISLRMGDQIQEYILRKHRPAFLDITNANTGTRLGAGSTAKQFAYLRMKVLGKLGVPGYQPYERLGLWLRRELRDLVGHLLLTPEFLDQGLFNPDGVRRIIAENDAKHRNHTYLILAMMIHAVALRHTLEGLRYVGPRQRVAECSHC